MSQISAINKQLKKILRQQNITYRQIANHLDMSEANVKRIFSTKQFTLARLEQICHVAGLELFDLFASLEREQEKLTSLTVEQEQELISDNKLFLVAVCVRDAWRLEDIVHYYQITEHECIRLLAKLDRLKVLQLLPNNEYKLLIAQDFRWIPNGPLEAFISKQVINQFLNASFSGENEFRFYLRGTYAPASINIIQDKLDQVMREAARLNQEDAKLPLANRQHIGLLLAMRPWQLPLFKQLRRTE